MRQGYAQEEMENAVRRAILETIERCAMVVQMWKAGPLFEDADPRVIALIKQEIADAIRASVNPSQPRPVEHEG